MVSRKRTVQAVLVVGFFITVSILLGSIPSETLINFIGSDNAFILMFVLGTVGGLTTFTGIPYHLILMSLAAGGINPIGLGVSTALGVMTGDSTMFLLSKKLKSSLSPKMLSLADTLAQRLNAHPAYITPVLVLYGTFSPFSNDFIVAAMSIMGYSYRRILVPLTIGNIFYNIALAYVGVYAYAAILNLF